MAHTGQTRQNILTGIPQTRNIQTLFPYARNISLQSSTAKKKYEVLKFEYNFEVLNKWNDLARISNSFYRYFGKCQEKVIERVFSAAFHKNFISTILNKKPCEKINLYIYCQLWAWAHHFFAEYRSQLRWRLHYLHHMQSLLRCLIKTVTQIALDRILRLTNSGGLMKET